MLRFTLLRLRSLLLALIVASLVIFCMIELVPGDPASFMLGINARPDTVNALREELGLNQPLVQRYISWVGFIIYWDFC